MSFNKNLNFNLWMKLSISYKTFEKLCALINKCSNNVFLVLILGKDAVMYTVSNKGKLILVLNGYEFYKEKERKDKCFWVCRRRFTHK